MPAAQTVCLGFFMKYIRIKNHEKIHLFIRPENYLRSGMFRMVQKINPGSLLCARGPWGLDGSDFET